ncbi:hypothetical protein ACSSS7_003441 [Eimeria intestinalis]
MRVRLKNFGGRLQLAPSLRRPRCSFSSFNSGNTASLSGVSCFAGSAYEQLPREITADAACARPHASCAKSRPPCCWPTDQDAACAPPPIDSGRQHYLTAAAAAAAAAAWVGSSKQKRGSASGKQHAAHWSEPSRRINEHAAPGKRRPSCFAPAREALVSLLTLKGLWGGPPAACREQQQQHQQQGSALFEQQQQQQQLVLTRAFENIRRAVVQVYAVLPVHRNHADAKSDPQTHREFRFLGSGFFFDDRDGKSPPHNEDASKQQMIEETAKASLDFPLAVKDSNGRLLAASLCGIDEATDIAVLRLEGVSHAKGKITSLQGKFSRSIPEMGEPVVTYAAAQSFKNISESSCCRFLHLQLLTLPASQVHYTAAAGPLMPSAYVDYVLPSNAGMSGAPVCDLDGNVVGMLVKKFDVCGLALSGPLVLLVAEALRDVGAFAPPSIGVLVEDVPPDFASEDNGHHSPGGVRVCSVAPGSAAAQAGLREGDKILVAKGEATKSVMELRQAVLFHKKGPFDLKVERGEETLDLRVDVKA